MEQLFNNKFGNYKNNLYISITIKERKDMETKTLVEVKESDLKIIGETAYDVNGYATIICDNPLERIILSSVLGLFDKKITDSLPFEWEDGRCSIEYRTNLPWNLYQEICSK